MKDEYRFMEIGLFGCNLPWKQQILIWAFLALKAGAFIAVFLAAGYHNENPDSLLAKAALGSAIIMAMIMVFGPAVAVITESLLSRRK